MKKSTTALLLLLLFTACKIKKEEMQPVQKPVINGQLFSYGTNTPVAGAAIHSKKCTKADFVACTDWDQKTTTSAADGSFTVQRDYLDNIRIHAPGYWSYVDEVDNGYVWFDGSATPRGSMQYIVNNGSLEKVIINLVQEAKVNVHIKNTSFINDSIPPIPFYLVAEGNIGSHNIMSNYFPLRKGIDTTFEYTAFANMNNRLSIKRGYGFIVSSDSTFTSKEVFLTAGNNASLAINF
ncbi:hypothetical protein WG954_18235 [Lacibacter sp. H375]|uniref:hypothetical protein n=1 Tax=Lacibacter sp. H375 TaxID=3133424 RepID=UPI0030C3A745